jgi:acetyl esterase/lipase
MSRVAALALLVLALTSSRTFADSPPSSHQQDVIYSRKFGTALTLDVFRPTKEANGLGLIFIVSSAWFSSHDMINLAYIKPFTDRGYTVFAVVHSCPPRFAMTEIIDDVKRSVRFIRYHAKGYGVDPDRLGIYGTSAGGHLSLMQATLGDKGNASAEDPVNREPSRVAVVACFFPPTDFLNYGKPDENALGRGILKEFESAFDFHELDPKSKMILKVTDEQRILELGRLVSPINHVTADDPPTLIIHGDADLMVPIQQARSFVEKLKAAGVEAKLVVKPGAGHGTVDLDKDIPTLADWFDSHLKKPVVPKAQPAALIRANQARDHIDESLTVETIIRTSKDAAKRKEIFLDSEPDFFDPKNFAVVVGYEALDRFKAAGIADLVAYYTGKKLRVTGTIVREDARVRIRVEGPEQIEVVK